MTLNDELAVHIARWENAADYWKVVNQISDNIIEILPKLQTLNDYYALSKDIGMLITKSVMHALKEADILNVLAHTHNRDLLLHPDKNVASISASDALMEIAINVMIADGKSKIRHFFCTQGCSTTIEKNEN